MRYDLTSAAFLRDPRPMVSAMRADGPVVRVRLPLLGQVWMTTTDAGARTVLKDTARFVRDSKPITGKGMAERFWYLPGFMQPLFQNLVNADGADHKRLRGLVDRAFARTSIDDLRPEIGQMAADLLAPLPTDRPVDVARHLARPLPTAAICSLLGVPAADRAQVMRMTAPLANVTGAWGLIRALPALWRTMRYFRAACLRVRQMPEPGLITALVQTHDAGDTLSDDELLAMIIALFLAGSETTAHLITMCIQTICTLPEARDVMLHQRDSLPLLIEEVMRFHAPVFMTQPLFVADDTDLDGVALAKGDQIVPFLLGANHDPMRFDAPGTLVPARRPNAHLGFGSGPHVCLGMQLARAEASEALIALFDRYPDARIADPAVPPVYAKRIGVHGLASLKLVLRP